MTRWTGRTSFCFSLITEWHNNMPVPVKANPERVDFAKDEPLKRECMHFLECAANGQMPATDWKEGLRVLRILNTSQ